MVTETKQRANNKQRGGYKMIEPRWLPGESGNPNGRPKNSVTTLLRNTDEQTNEQIAKKLIELALAGDLPALIHYIDRTDGKVADKLQLTGTMLVATPDQLDLAMRLMLENKANEAKLLEAGKVT